MESRRADIEVGLVELRRLLNTDFAALAWAADGEPAIRWKCASGNRNERYKRMVLRPGKGVVGTVLRSGRPLVLESFVPQSGDDPRDYSILLAEGLQAIAAVPLLICDRVRGVLLVGCRQPRLFQPTELELMENLAEQMGSWLQPKGGDCVRPFEESPFLVIWEVTRACELACLHCRAEAQPLPDPRQLNTEEGFHLLEQIRQFGNPVVVLTGGDPLLRPDVFELIAYGVKLGLRMSMTPSATPNVTREAIQKAKEAGLSRWAFSLDGSNAAIHDAFRGVAGSFDRTLEAIEYLHELGLPLQINTTVSRYNLHDLGRLALLVTKLRAVLWSVFFLVPTGRGKREDMISPEQHEQVLHWLYDLSKTAPFDIKTTAAPHYRRVVLQRRKARGETVSRQKLLGVQGGTGGSVDGIGRPQYGVNDGNGLVFISHLGDVFPSGFLPLPAGNVRTRPLVDIYRNSPIFRELRNPDLYKGKCGICPFRYVCGGSRARAYALSGDYLASEPCCTYLPPHSDKKV